MLPIFTRNVVGCKGNFGPSLGSRCMILWLFIPSPSFARLLPGRYFRCWWVFLVPHLRALVLRDFFQFFLVALPSALGFLPFRWLVLSPESPHFAFSFQRRSRESPDQCAGPHQSQRFEGDFGRQLSSKRFVGKAAFKLNAAPLLLNLFRTTNLARA